MYEIDILAIRWVRFVRFIDDSKGQNWMRFQSWLWLEYASAYCLQWTMNLWYWLWPDYFNVENKALVNMPTYSDGCMEVLTKRQGSQNRSITVFLANERWCSNTCLECSRNQHCHISLLCAQRMPSLSLAVNRTRCMHFRTKLFLSSMCTWCSIHTANLAQADLAQAWPVLICPKLSFVHTRTLNRPGTPDMASCMCA